MPLIVFCDHCQKSVVLVPHKLLEGGGFDFDLPEGWVQRNTGLSRGMMLACSEACRLALSEEYGLNPNVLDDEETT